MYSVEIIKEKQMSYSQLVAHLQNKYGKAKGDYYVNHSCKCKNGSIKRTNEGLVIHHVDEDKAILLSNNASAATNPFDYQKADRLVYCNMLEHLLLHIKIVEEPRNENANKGEAQGICGVICFLCPQINDYYNGYQFKKQYLLNEFALIKDNFDDYIKLLQYFMLVMTTYEFRDSIPVTKEKLSEGWNNQIISKIYDML